MGDAVDRRGLIDVIKATDVPFVWQKSRSPDSLNAASKRV